MVQRICAPFAVSLFKVSGLPDQVLFLNNMSPKKYILLVVLLSAVIGLGGYYYFGGFTPRQQQLVEVNDYYLVGRHYKGRLDNNALEEIFYEVRSQHEKGEPSGVLTIVTLKEPLTAKDTVEQFIGLLTETPYASPLPAGWERFTLETNRAVRNTIRAHNLVMPKPYEIKEEIQEFANKNNLNLKSDVSIEKYMGERHLEVEIPVRD